MRWSTLNFVWKAKITNACSQSRIVDRILSKSSSRVTVPSTISSLRRRSSRIVGGVRLIISFYPSCLMSLGPSVVTLCRVVHKCWSILLNQLRISHAIIMNSIIIIISISISHALCIVKYIHSYFDLLFYFWQYSTLYCTCSYSYNFILYKISIPFFQTKPLLKWWRSKAHNNIITQSIEWMQIIEKWNGEHLRALFHLPSLMFRIHSYLFELNNVLTVSCENC